ncbi:KTSC domain-containing protein [Flavobacterium sp.]|uniref:KTSC domain-containing protein n=1 Tax=Flavobacterium sp. TaxID=239 RepID=UPI00375274E0
MNRFPVNATNIMAIGYDEINEILEIEFILEVIHHYFNVPLNEFVSLMKATCVEEYYFKYVLCKYHFDALDG